MYCDLKGKGQNLVKMISMKCFQDSLRKLTGLYDKIQKNIRKSEKKNGKNTTYLLTLILFYKQHISNEKDYIVGPLLIKQNECSKYIL